VNPELAEHKLPDFSHIQFQYFTIERLSPRLMSFQRVLVWQFSGTFKPNSECDEWAQFAWIAALAEYARTMFEADGYIMDVSKMEYEGEMLLDDLMGDVYVNDGIEKRQINVVNDSMRRAVHDRDMSVLSDNLQEGLALLEEKMLDSEQRWKEKEEAKERERLARRQQST
jgi:hypothetical protein